MNRITMPTHKPIIPAKQTHMHQLCGHWCACYSAMDATCRKCQRNAAFNERATA